MRLRWCALRCRILVGKRCAVGFIFGYDSRVILTFPRLFSQPAQPAKRSPQLPYRR
jgi:hypothetical protein